MMTIMMMPEIMVQPNAPAAVRAFASACLSGSRGRFAWAAMDHSLRVSWFERNVACGCNSRTAGADRREILRKPPCPRGRQPPPARPYGVR